MIQAGDDSQVFDLLVAELPVGSIHLRENVAGVDEQDLVLFVRLGLVLVKEPERSPEENILEGSVTIWLMMPSSIIFFRISYSLLPASEAELAITSAALPCSFRAVAK